MKIYTKPGDRGQSVLFDGTRVAKTHARLETYGTVDELNTVLRTCQGSGVKVRMLGGGHNLLIRDEPVGGAVVRLTAEPFTFLKRDGDLAAADSAQRDELPGVLDYLERELPAEGWLVGDFSLADIAVAGPLVNLGYCGCAVDAGHHPNTAAFLARVTQRPSIAPVIAREAAILASVRGS